MTGGEGSFAKLVGTMKGAPPDSKFWSVIKWDINLTMPRYFACHWQNRFWRKVVNREYEPLASSGSNSFRKRGISPGDIAYIVSLADGQLLLGGRMTVKQIVSRNEAVKVLRRRNLYPADEWIIGEGGSGTPLNLHRALAPALSRQLRFSSPRSEPKGRGLFFVSKTHLDNQATRGIRELTADSAALLDRVIDITDQLPRSTGMITVDEQMLANGISRGAFELAEKIPHGASRNEGSVQRILVNRYERDARARRDCIRYYQPVCVVCGFDFAKVYGAAISGFTHVHHLIPLSSIGKDYRVDGIKDLRPVCPNCHTVAHRREPPYSLDEIREMIRKQLP